MTVSSVVVRAVAGWTGAETEFPTGIQVLAKSQLAVSLVPDEGARLPLTLGLHYTVALSPAGVATVVPLPAFPAVAGEVSFVRRTPMTQDYDPAATDTYDAAGHAAALDRSAMRVAELSQAVDDIAAASVVISGGAASVPEGAVYVSDGAGRAVAGPTAAQIEAARMEAIGAVGTATGAAGAAMGAATTANRAAALADQLANAAPDTPVGSGYSGRHWAHVAETLAASMDMSSYSTTAQITTMLSEYALKTLTIASGTGILINGGASATLGGTVTVSLDLTAKALAKDVWTAGVSTTPAPIDPETLKKAVTTFSTSVPSGTLAYFAGSSPPSGWLECNGAAISRTAYAALFAAIDTVFGTGDGSTTFNLPDRRGVFDRGHDHGRGLDSGRVFGSYQADDFKSHYHSYRAFPGTTGNNNGSGGSAPAAADTGATGGTETRPKNIALLPIIKY